jgi:hypothetical protein
MPEVGHIRVYEIIRFVEAIEGLFSSTRDELS